MDNKRKILAGGVLGLVALVMVACGCVASSNNTPASNTVSLTAAAGENASATPAPSPDMPAQSATETPSGSRASPTDNSPTATPGPSPTDTAPGSSTAPSGQFYVVTTMPGLGTTSPISVKKKLATPQLLSPENGVNFVEVIALPFDWKPVLGASGYYFEEQYNDGDGWHKLKSANVAACTYSDLSMANHKNNRWRVTAMDSTGTYLTSDPSGWWTVTFGPNPTQNRILT